MKVTLVTGEYPPMRGGVADYTALLADGLVDLGVEVAVLTSKQAVTSPRDGVAPVDAVVESWGIRSWRDIGKHVSRFRPDVLHVQYQTGAFDMRLGINLLPWLNRLRGGQPPVVVTFHDLKEPYIFPKLGAARHLATHILTSGADAVVVTNPEDLDLIRGRSVDRTRRLLGGRRIASIPIGSNILALANRMDPTRVKVRIGARPDEAIVVFFGFIGPSKGIDDLVEAFKLLVERGVLVRLLIVGAASGDSGYPDRGYENLIRQRLDHPLIRGRVSWTGFLSPGDVGVYLSAADVCCLPFREGVSIRHGTLIAAIEHGLAIVSTSRPDVDSVNAFPRLASGENILLVDAANPVALADGIEKVLVDDALRQRLSSGARNLAPAFDWRAIARETLHLYEQVRAR